MRYMMKKGFKSPFLTSCRDIIIEVNNEFTEITGFQAEEIVGKSLAEIGHLLCIEYQLDFKNIQEDFDGYIFTKGCKPIEVHIHIEKFNDGITKQFHFICNTNSCIEEKFAFAEQFYTDKRTSVAMCTFPGLILLKANQNYLDFLDPPYNKIEINIGKKQKELMSDHENATYGALWHENIANNKSYYIEEYKYDLYKEGVTYWNISLVPVVENEQVKYFIQASLDVTEKVMNRSSIKEQESIIKQQKEELETIIENMSDALMIFDKEGSITRFNKAARNSFFYETRLLKNIDDIYKNTEYFDGDRNLISYNNSPAKRILNGEKIIEYKLASKNNNEYAWTEINGTPVYDNQGDFVTGIMCSRNITQKIKNQEMQFIKAQYEILNRMIENLDLTVIRLSYPDLLIKDMNQKVYKQFKKINPKLQSLGSIRGMKYLDVIEDDYRKEVDQDFRCLLESKRGTYSRERKHRCGGEDEYTKIMYQSVYGLNNEIIEIAVIEYDITQEVRAKHQMEKTLKKQEELFANVSHELKTPLNVIFSMTQLFEFYLNNDLFSINKEKIIKGTQVVKQNCYRLTKLISNIVDLSKIESGFLELNLSNENIVSIVEDIVQSVSEYVEGKGLCITFDTNVEEKIIACDVDKIERALLNLISNAIKFSEYGNDIFVNVVDKSDIIEISVKDSGIGIDEAHLESIFERFHQVDKSFTRNTEGSGIGLSLVKSIVKLHDGNIRAESKVGEGSTFIIEIPAKIVETHELENVSKSEECKIEKVNIEFSDIYTT